MLPARDLLKIACVIGCSCLAAQVVAGAEPHPGSLAQVELLQNTLASVADEVRPSIVAIRADRHLDALSDDSSAPDMPDDETHQQLRDRTVPAVGTGMIIGADGLILTNEHVIHAADPQDIEIVTSDGEAYSVQGITSDPRSDLAVLRVDAKNLKPIHLGDLSTVKQGHFAIVMGNPFGSASDNHGRPAMSFGIISAIGQVLTEQLDPKRDRYYGNLIQTDARINPGNSGGPLLNIKGEVIGINTAISTRSGASEGVGYAIPIDKVTREIIAQLSKGEEVQYGMLGVRLAEPTTDERKLAGAPASGGARVTEVEFGTPAAEAGLAPDDIIVEFGGQSIHDVDELVRMVGAARAGIKVDVAFFRAQKRMSLAVTPARKQVLSGINILSWRGMKLANPTQQVRKQFKLGEKVDGLVVTHVDDGSSADKAGIRPGQVIRQVADVKLDDVQKLRKNVAQLAGPLKVVLADDPPTELTLP